MKKITHNLFFYNFLKLKIWFYFIYIYSHKIWDFYLFYQYYFNLFYNEIKETTMYIDCGRTSWPVNDLINCMNSFWWCFSLSIDISLVTSLFFHVWLLFLYLHFISLKKLHHFHSDLMVNYQLAYSGSATECFIVYVLVFRFDKTSLKSW